MSPAQVWHAFLFRPDDVVDVHSASGLLDVSCDRRPVACCALLTGAPRFMVQHQTRFSILSEARLHDRLPFAVLAAFHTSVLGCPNFEH